MMRALHPRNPLGRFVRDQDAAILVEFVLALPLMLILFAVIIEGSRLMLSYQSTISGVREATRYMSRILPRDLCTAEVVLIDYDTQLHTIVGESMTGRQVRPSAVTLSSVTSRCGPIDYLSETAPVVEVTANLEIHFPLGGLFTLFGGPVGPVTATVADRSRVFGS